MKTIFFIIFPIYLSLLISCVSTTNLSSDEQHEIINELQQLINDHYILDDKAILLVTGLSTAVEEGVYDDVLPATEFIQQTNRILQTAFPDRHLSIIEPNRFAELQRLFNPDIESTEGHENTEGHSVNQGDDSSMGREQRSLNDIRSIAGISRVSEISRDGYNQIGYIAFEELIDSDRARSIINNIFSTFSESQRVIIDLRDCRGGDADMVKFISSYFFDEPTHLVSTQRNDGSNTERWTEPNQLSSVFANKQLDILISNDTFSAGESFAFGMQATGRARLTGEATGGGGHMNNFFALPLDFGASISVGRTYDPRTGEGWQAEGVKPDIEFAKNHAMSDTLALITSESGKLDLLGEQEFLIYQQLQSYISAWYTADGEEMSKLISPNFKATYSGVNGEVVRDFGQQIESTQSGEGALQNIFHNRIFRTIVASPTQGTATVILRETVHEISLIRTTDGWAISRDDYVDKEIHG